ncbi:MAG: Gfo/Idh/MocA family oxidoreductase [Spirochaetaceae bacterium]|nr:MAG: Gfo/Idh/MocA family oxidoreductase [Spirochaetaceae bacterium]
MAEKKKVRVGLLGAGWIGQHHGLNVISNTYAELAAVCDLDSKRAKAYLDQNNSNAIVFDNLEKMLEQRGIEAIVIASPNASHEEHAVAAAEAGKHVYLEKPMAITLEGCRRIVKAVEKKKVKFAMGYHRRLNPLVQYAKSLIAEGKLGELVFIESDYFHHVPGDLDIWSWLGKNDIAGSIIHAGTGHNIDLIRFFCGEVAEVSCYKDVVMPRKIQMETEDLAVINLRFKSGALGRVGLFLGPILPFTFTLRVFGTKGTVDNNRVWLDTIPRFADFGHEEDYIRLPQSWIADNVQGGVSETWKQNMDTFIDDIRLDREPFNGAQSGFNTAAVCFAALQSAAEKRSIKPEVL